MAVIRARPAAAVVAGETAAAVVARRTPTPTLAPRLTASTCFRWPVCAGAARPPSPSPLLRRNRRPGRTASWRCRSATTGRRTSRSSDATASTGCRAAARSIQGQPHDAVRAVPAPAGWGAPHTASAEPAASGGTPGADARHATGVALRPVQGQPGHPFRALPAPAGRRAPRPARETRIGDATAATGPARRAAAPAPAGPAEANAAQLAATTQVRR